MSKSDQPATVAVDRGVRPCDRVRMAFDAWARENRKDLDLRHTHDDRGNYCYDGYIWAETADAFRTWQAGIEWAAGPNV